MENQISKAEVKRRIQYKKEELQKLCECYEYNCKNFAATKADCDTVLDTISRVIAQTKKEIFELKQRLDEKPKIKYFVLGFAIDGNSNETSSMCVLGYRLPTVEEATEFWKEDCAKYPDEKLTAIYEITSKQAHDEFDMDEEASFPVFGTDRKNCVEILSDSANKEFRALKKEILSQNKEAYTANVYVVSAMAKIREYLCDRAKEHFSDHAIKTLADLGNRVIETLYQYYMETRGCTYPFLIPESNIPDWVEDYCAELMANEE